MENEHLIKWGKDAFEKGFSLDRIEEHLMKRGMKEKEALLALHEITSFEHKLHKEVADLRRDLISIPVLLFLLLSGLIFLYIAGIIKYK